MIESCETIAPAYTVGVIGTPLCSTAYAIGGDAGGGGLGGGTNPANWASSSRLMPLAVRKSAAWTSPEHVILPSPTAVHRNGSMPSTLVLSAIAAWRPAMRSSLAVAGSGGQGGGDAGGCRGSGESGGATGGGGEGGGGGDPGGGGGVSSTHTWCSVERSPVPSSQCGQSSHSHREPRPRTPQ